MPNVESSLLMLTIKLSETKCKSLLILHFIEGISEIMPNYKFSWHTVEPKGIIPCYAVSTSTKTYGFIQAKPSIETDKPLYPHFCTALKLLAFFIENIEQKELLQNSPQELIDSRKELDDTYLELASTNEELIESNKRLLESNKILLDEIKRREKAEEEQLKLQAQSEQNKKELEEKNKQLTNQNLFIQTILDNLPIGLALNNLDNGAAIYMNKKFEEVYGWDSTEIISVETFFKKVYPNEEYRKQLIERVLGDIQSGDSSKMHWENIQATRKDGSKRIINAVNIPLPNLNTMVSTVIDITELKNAESELSYFNNLLSKFISNSPIYAYIKEVTETESRVIKVSDNFIDMIGVDSAYMVGKTMHELFPPEFATKITDDDWTVASEGRKIVLEEELNGKYYITYKFPINEEDKVLLAGYTIDISEQKKLTKELIAAKEKAEESDKLKSSFLANLSHEIRTPMNSIMGFASLLPEEESKELMSQYANIIVRNSEQLVHIIDDIVLYSRLQTRLLQLFPKEFNTFDLLKDIKHSFNLPDYQKGVELKIEMQADMQCKVKTDYEKLRQVFTNLISNAFKYTPSGTITIGTTIKNEQLYFFVKDTGIGIPEQERGKVFERFYRGSNTKKESISGTGLGLSIVKELLELLGGQIQIESELGKGTNFWFTIDCNFTVEEK